MKSGVLLLFLFLGACAAEAPPPQAPSPKEAALSPALPASSLPSQSKPSLPSSQEACVRPPPEGFVDLRSFLPSLRFDIRYATRDNFTGAPLPGYGAPGAWMRTEVAEALARVQSSLEPEGLGLLIYDAYRPIRASRAMVEWTRETHQEHLLAKGYIASKSGHNHGNTIDLTLIDLQTGEPLDMGTPYDLFDEASHTGNATGAALENRLRLKAAMQAQGFSPYSKEWWHFSYKLEETSAKDIPYGCEEEPAFLP